MVDPILASVGQLEGLAQPEAVKGAGGANMADVERFNTVMEQPLRGSDGLEGVAGVDGISGQGLQAMSEVPNTMVRSTITMPEADTSLVQGLDYFSAESHKMHSEVVQSLANAGEMGEMFKLQFQVANLTTTQTMVGQTGQKGSQGVQTLLKGQ